MKRVADFVIGITALVILSPVIVVIAVLVRWKLGRPVLFRQQRAGLAGAPFELLKFRTMSDAIGPDGGSLPDEQRLSPFGAKLREYSLDELPELWNVVRGDISLVGPRPLLPKYLDRYSTHQARRHEVKPGITGLAQVSGRNATTWAERLDLDVWYVDHRSFWLDAKILIRTAVSVLKREGIAADGHATMPEFWNDR